MNDSKGIKKYYYYAFTKQHYMYLLTQHHGAEHLWGKDFLKVPTQSP